MTWLILENIDQRSVNDTSLPPRHCTLEMIGANDSGRATCHLLLASHRLM